MVSFSRLVGRVFSCTRLLNHGFQKIYPYFFRPPPKKKHQTSLWRNPVLWPPFAHLIDKVVVTHGLCGAHNMATNDKNIRLQNSQFSKPLIKSRCPVGPGRWIGPKPSKSIQTWTRVEKLDASETYCLRWFPKTQEMMISSGKTHPKF